MKRTRGVERPLTIFNPPTSPDPQLAHPTHQQPLPLVWQPNATHASLPQVRLPRVQPRVHLAQSICMAPNYHKPLPYIALATEPLTTARQEYTHIRQPAHSSARQRPACYSGQHAQRVEAGPPPPCGEAVECVSRRQAASGTWQQPVPWQLLEGGRHDIRACAPRRPNTMDQTHDMRVGGASCRKNTRKTLGSDSEITRKLPVQTAAATCRPPRVATRRMLQWRR